LIIYLNFHTTGYLENDDDENDISIIESEADFCKLLALSEKKKQ